MFFVGQVSGLIEYWDLLRHRKCDKCQTLHYGITHQALPVHTTFRYLYPTSRSQQCRTVLTENVVFLSN